MGPTWKDCADLQRLPSDMSAVLRAASALRGAVRRCRAPVCRLKSAESPPVRYLVPPDLPAGRGLRDAPNCTATTSAVTGSLQVGSGTQQTVLSFVLSSVDCALPPNTPSSTFIPAHHPQPLVSPPPTPAQTRASHLVCHRRGFGTRACAHTLGRSNQASRLLWRGAWRAWSSSCSSTLAVRHNHAHELGSASTPRHLHLQFSLCQLFA